MTLPGRSYSEAAMTVAREGVTSPTVRGGLHCFAADVWYRGHRVYGYGRSPEEAVQDLAVRLSDFAGLPR